MAPSRPLLLLLLLTGPGCSHLPGVQGKPSDFWCDHQHRTDMQNMTERLARRTAGCTDLDSLPAPIQLPCVSIQAAAWANKSVQQKSAEVMGALQVFHEGLQGPKNQTSSRACLSTLSKLETRISNYIAIVKLVYKQNGASQVSVDRCSSVNSLNQVLRHFGKLLKVKLEALAFALNDSMCNGDQRTLNGR
ncbi:uncharacterized protein LOC114868688 isoform X2 [Betta splendens]|uniref:Uncharacterized protein LOC114868688 isoform X2 n=1 Tax=Betta splendens TaxID=158456 RepID=A0A6P7P714_BETSP|nr:uncharacterized protein LOC114868688 isoform X2 [Betta splendens]